MTEMPELQRISARVASLTRLTIAASCLAGAALLLASAAFLRPGRAAQPPALPDTVTATEVTIHDDSGNLRARLTSHGLALVDKNGRMRAAVTMSDDGAPNLTFVGADGRVRTVMGLGSEDSPGLTLHDRLGRVRARVAVGTDDAPSVTLSDDKGASVSGLPPPPVRERKGR